MGLQPTPISVIRTEDALRAILDGTASLTGDEFFRALARHLAIALGFKYALIGELIGPNSSVVRTLAVWGTDAVPENIEYDLAGTPCAQVVGRAPKRIVTNVIALYPTDAILAELGVESYIGVPLFDSHRKPLGILALLDDEPLDETFPAQTILEVFATRAAVEIEREHKAAALRESEGRYQSLADASPVGIFYLDQTGATIHRNARSREIIGIRGEDLGFAWMKYVHPEDRERVFREWEKSRGAGEPFHSEYRFLHPDGDVVWALVQVIPRLSSEGKLIGWVGTSTDITDRKKTEEELSKSEKRFRLLIEQAPTVIWTCDTALRFTSTQGGGLSSVQLQPDESNGQTLWEFFNTSDSTLPSIAAHQQALQGKSCNFEQDYRARVFQCYVEPMRGADGKIEGTIGVAFDITERKVAERALMEARDMLESRVRQRTGELELANAVLQEEVSERLRAEATAKQRASELQAIFRASPDLFFRVDADGTLLDYIAGPSGDLYVPPEVFLGRKMRDVLPADVSRVIDEARERALAKASVTAVEYALTMPPGLRDFEARVIPLGEDQVVMIVRDITSRKHAEEALRQREEHFKELAFSNQLLLLEVDHRVRNNLAGLLSLIALMRQRTKNVESFADAIESRLQGMVQVHQLLADQQWRPVKLRTIIESLINVMSKMENCIGKIVLDGPDIPISARQTLPVSMILMEWLTNSCKYGSYSVAGGRIDIAWKIVSDDGTKRTRLTWKESNGPPIPQPVVPSLGTELVKSFAAIELRGRCELKFPKSGVHHVLEFPSD